MRKGLKKLKEKLLSELGNVTFRYTELKDEREYVNKWMGAKDETPNDRENERLFKYMYENPRTRQEAEFIRLMFIELLIIM